MNITWFDLAVEYSDLTGTLMFESEDLSEFTVIVNDYIAAKLQLGLLVQKSEGLFEVIEWV